MTLAKNTRVRFTPKSPVGRERLPMIGTDREGYVIDTFQVGDGMVCATVHWDVPEGTDCFTSISTMPEIDLTVIE